MENSLSEKDPHVTYNKPSVGRVVHYIPAANDSSEVKGSFGQDEMGVPFILDEDDRVARPILPAIITRVWNKEGLVNLQIFTNSYQGLQLKTSVLPGNQPGQWSWPTINK